MRSVATKKGYNQLPTTGIDDPAVINFIGALQIFLQRHQQQNYDDINNLQQLEIVASGSVPTATAALRGKMILVDGGDGVADVIKVCIENADETYSFKTVGLS